MSSYTSATGFLVDRRFGFAPSVLSLLLDLRVDFALAPPLEPLVATPLVFLDASGITGSLD
jgi:hypothetical protein